MPAKLEDATTSVGPPVDHAPQLWSIQPVGGVPTSNVWSTSTDANEYQEPARPPRLQMFSSHV